MCSAGKNSQGVGSVSRRGCECTQYRELNTSKQTCCLVHEVTEGVHANSYMLYMLYLVLCCVKSGMNGSLYCMVFCKAPTGMKLVSFAHAPVPIRSKKESRLLYICKRDHRSLPVS